LHLERIDQIELTFMSGQPAQAAIVVPIEETERLVSEMVERLGIA
jgi:hypothetical protein